MYKPRWKIPDAPIESSETEEGNQVIDQLANDQVLIKTEKWKQNFLTPFVLEYVVTFTIMFGI